MEKIKTIKKILLVVFITLGVIFLSFEKTLAFGPGEYTKKNIAIVGDSYIDFFKHFVSADDFEYYEFPSDKGIAASENVQVFMHCIADGDNTYILFCSGVNDFLNKTKPEDFEQYLRFYIALAAERNKCIFFHTYMSFYRSDLREDDHSVKELDDVYRKLANEFSNVYYIDMKNMDNEDYAFGDGYNYDETFFVTLSSKMIYLTEAIESTNNTTVFPWSYKMDKNKIAVTGDTFAYHFIEYEKTKYTLLDFVNQGTILQNHLMSFYGAVESDARYVLLSIGIEDFEAKTPIIDFEKSLRIYLNLACLKHKTVFLHSYMHFIGERPTKVPKVSEYNAVIEKLAEEYPNTKYIDMNDFATAEYQGDTKYYNQGFYDKLYDKMIERLGETNAI